MGMIEFTPIRMFAIDARNRVFRKLARVGVLHEATRETERISHIARPTDFRIWQTALTTVRVIDHGFPAFAKLR